MKKNTKNLFLISCLVVFFLLVLFSTTSFAAEINVEFSDPNLGLENSSIPGFLNNFYKFGVGVGGVLAIGMIVVGGIYYITSGVIQKKNEGKEIILSALWGLTLLLGAFLILRTINPRLVELENPGGQLEQADFQSCSEKKELPECKKNEESGQYDSERDENGNCVCRVVDKENTCPIDVKTNRVEADENAPIYTWTKEYGSIPNRDDILEWDYIPDISEVGGCPSYVRILPNTSPYFITGADDERFILDLSKQKLEGLELPLLDGEYWGRVSSMHLKNHPEKALCIITHVTGKSGGNQIEIFLPRPEKLNLCTGFSDSMNSTAEIEVEADSDWSQGGSCTVGAGECSIGKLQSRCSVFGDKIEKVSKICTYESGGENPNALSGTDFCATEISKPKSERHPFSMGLFQINVIANHSLVTELSGGDASCEGLYDGKSKKNPGGWKTGYKCVFKNNKAEQWERCRQLLSNPELNTKIACRLFGGGGLNPWKTTAKYCGLY